MPQRLALALLLLFIPCTAAFAAMDEASLITAWEQQMAQDSGTLAFERIDEGRYRFETERFPYTGEIRILNTDIYQDPYSYGENYAMGVVELELADLPEDFFMKHSTSYYNWERNNVLYYDMANDAWMSEAQWSTAWVEGSDCYPSLFGVGWDLYFWLVVLIVFIIILIFLSRKTTRQMKTAMAAQDQALKGQDEALALTRQAIELQREALGVLKEIRDEYKKGKQ